MAAKSKAAPKAAAKKAAPRKRAAVAPVFVESASAISGADGTPTVLINGVEHTMSVQTLLALRRDINELAAGYVH